MVIWFLMMVEGRSLGMRVIVLYEKRQGYNYMYGLEVRILKFGSNLSEWFAGTEGVSALSNPFIAPTYHLSHCLWQKRSPPNSLLLSLPLLNLSRLRRAQGGIEMLIWCRLKSTIHFTPSIPHISPASPSHTSTVSVSDRQSPATATPQEGWYSQLTLRLF